MCYFSNNFSSLVQHRMKKMHIDIKDNLKDKLRGHQNEKSETETEWISSVRFSYYILFIRYFLGKTYLEIFL